MVFAGTNRILRNAAILLLSGCTLVHVPAAETNLAVLEAGDRSYTNVVIDRQTESHLFILHDGGMAALKIDELDLITRSNLGLPLPRPAIVPTTNAVVATNAAPNQTEAKGSDPAESSPRLLAVAVFGTLVIGLATFVCVVFFRNRQEWSIHPVKKSQPFETPEEFRPPPPAPPPPPPVVVSKPFGGREKDEDGSRARNTAAVSLYAPFVALALLMYSTGAIMETPFVRIVLGGFALLAIPTGFVCGIVALCKVKRYGAEWILKRAVFGTLLGALAIAAVALFFTAVAAILLSKKEDKPAAEEVASRNVGREFPLLKAGEQTFTNVTITRESDVHVFITHDGGMSTINILDFDGMTQTNLGITPRQIFRASAERSGAATAQPRPKERAKLSLEELEAYKTHVLYALVSIGVVTVLLLVFAWRWVVAMIAYFLLGLAAVSAGQAAIVFHTTLQGGTENPAYWLGFAFGGLTVAAVLFVLFRLLERLSEWEKSA